VKALQHCTHTHAHPCAPAHTHTNTHTNTHTHTHTHTHTLTLTHSLSTARKHTLSLVSLAADNAVSARSTAPSDNEESGLTVLSVERRYASIWGLEDEPFACTMCSYRTTHKTYLNAHYRCHSDAAMAELHELETAL
jgi:hypothetical protein